MPCPTRARRFVRGPAPGLSRAAPTFLASLQVFLSGRSPPSAHGPPPAALVPLLQQGDPSKVPLCTRAVMRGCGSGEGRDRLPPPPSIGPGSLLCGLQIRSGVPAASRAGWPGLARFTAFYSIDPSGAMESYVRHRWNLGHAPQLYRAYV
ncbi:hypothetical protein NDU88_005044 [Pleurodeles waltl]|uniref:Uncharacterized protein n=1 Tax=Pleurodeles waltl TaxID=8319 RepID=A0AAV7WXF2_PLEWA|nr:hypothetical protein NDU88_005044 [Pleurodeles waltl]